MLISKNFLFIIAISLPLALVLWTSNAFLSNVLRIQQISIVRWFASVFVPILFTYWGLKKNSLSTSGAAAGIIVGFVITLSNAAFLFCLMAFFVSSSKVTKFRSNLKKDMEEDFVEGGQRNWIQVLANGLVATMIAVTYMNDCGCRELPMDIVNRYKCTFLSYALLGAFACTNGDTWSSEVGPVVTWSSPVLITTLKPVPKGTNGGVSIAGLIASIMGGAIVGLSFYVALVLFVPSRLYSHAPSQWPIIVHGAIGGLLGSLIDSFLGATMQYSGITENGIIVERPGSNVKHISGCRILNNHSVNLLSSLATSLILPLVVLSLTDL